MTNDDFDPDVLRRLDAPRRPSPAATESIRAAMLDAFDEEVERAGGIIPDETSDLQPEEVDEAVTDEPAGPSGVRHLEIALEPLESDESAERTRPGAVERPTSFWRIAGYVAIAAAVVAVIAGVIATRSGTVELEPMASTDADVDAVRGFCATEVEPLVDDLAAFVERPGGELSDRALRNSELLAQRYRDLAADLTGDLAAEVSATGDDLLQRAAEARREAADGSGDEAIRALVDDVVAAIAVLPGAESCRLTGLRDSSS